MQHIDILRKMYIKEDYYEELNGPWAWQVSRDSGENPGTTEENSGLGYRFMKEEKMSQRGRS